MTTKIDKIEIFRLHYPLVGFFKFFRTPAIYPVILVKITADNGMVGWGESLPVPTWSYETPETAAIVLRQYFAPALIGRDPLDIEEAHRTLDRVLAPSFSTGMPLTRAGLDLALHDLAGKLTGRSVGELLGRPRGGPIELSWTINVRTLDEVDSQVEAARQRGYRSFNVKVAPDPAFDVQVIRRLRQLAPEGSLWADANGGYDLAAALEAAPKLADAGVEVLECPLRPNRISGYQALKRQGALPITMDEGVVSAVDVEEFIRLGMVDGMTIKLSRCGGLAVARKQIETVLDAGLFWLGSGLTDPDISLAATLALFGAYGLEKPAALNGPQFVAADILAQPLPITGAIAAVPEGPGLGVAVDETKVAALMADKCE
jgi:L-alanine-DL-glutamate epimerase-like enolase superfamily enzyme